MILINNQNGVPGQRGKREASTGPPGNKGSKGDPGYQGYGGMRGLTGLPGDPGVNGNDGAKRDKGQKGTYLLIFEHTLSLICIGFDGVTGPKGFNGLRGPSGVRGSPGPPGRFPCVCKLFKIMLDEYYIIIPYGGLVHQTKINTATNQRMPGPPGPVANSYCVQG